MMPARWMVDVAIAWDLAGQPPLFTEDEAVSLLAFALNREGTGGAWTFGIRFVNDAEMRELHKRYMNDPSSTDIMTIPYEPEEGEQGGDIVISVDTAAENAAAHGWEHRDELRFLVLHGLLHILGWDDHDDAARSAMLDRQLVLLRDWEVSRAG